MSFKIHEFTRFHFDKSLLHWKFLGENTTTMLKIKVVILFCTKDSYSSIAFAFYCLQTLMVNVWHKCTPLLE